MNELSSLDRTRESAPHLSQKGSTRSRMNHGIDHIMARRFRFLLTRKSDTALRGFRMVGNGSLVYWGLYGRAKDTSRE
jgi:hypothetical protein